MGSAAPAVAEIDVEPQVVARNESSAESLRDVVLNALNAQPMLVSMLEAGQWSLEGSLLVARVSLSSTMIDMSFTADARRVASAAVSGAAGRPVKMQVLPGGTAQAASPARRPSSNGSARSRAEQDPVVRSMQEKFGAEIRTVIDYREKS
jgi:DNA polymerase-3 subunit gamma/tau